MNISKEALAAKALRDSIIETQGDENLAVDMIEGETGLMEAIDALLARMTNAQAYITGLNSEIERLVARRDRFVDRIESDRALIEQALTIAEISKLERPSATLSLRKSPQKLLVTDEAEVPARFWKTPPPVLDKAAIKVALGNEETVPGAILSNAAPTLAIRRD